MDNKSKIHWWNSSTDNKLHNIKPTIGESGYIKIRKEEIVLARLLCIKQITQLSLKKNEEPPICRAHKEQYTGKHM